MMAVLPVLTYPDERLKCAAARVEHFDGELQQLLIDLQETMDSGPPSVGIAATQVGVLWRVCVVDISGLMQRKRPPLSSYHQRLVLVNPEIVERRGETAGREGCLSVPDYTGNVMRAEAIELKAQNAAGELQYFSCYGFEARAIQHELDHLDGKLFLDRLVSPRELFRRKVYR